MGLVVHVCHIRAGNTLAVCCFLLTMELTSDRGEKHNKHKPVDILDTYTIFTFTDMQMQFLNMSMELIFTQMFHLF